MKIRAKSETRPAPSRSVEHRTKQKVPLRATTLDQSEREPIKVDVPLPSVDERAERRCNGRRQLSPTNAFANESKFIEATLHTMTLKGEQPSHLGPRPRVFKISETAFVEIVVDDGKPGP
jgi:hypothetical protein